MALSVGMWIWDVGECEGGDVSAIVARCTQAGLGHVLIKTNDGAAEYNGALGPLVSALNDAGVHVWAWQYTYGKEPEAEAEAFAQRALDLSVNGVCIDAEKEYEAESQASAADAYMTRLRSLTGTLSVAVSSFYLPHYHSQFPWNEFLGKSDYAMPQVYWFSRDPASALEASYSQYTEYIPAEKIIPTGAAYPQATGDPENIKNFLEAAERLGASMVNFWSWQHATSAMWAQITGRAGA